jgi:acyl transferase domain-containing protein
MLTHAVDFPRLVEQVYSDGARVFIELGAGSNCSKWVDAILKDRPHASTTINQNNVSDNVSILKLLARLVSQRVQLDLSVLSTVEQEVK